MNCNRKKENESEGAWIDRGGGRGRGGDIERESGTNGGSTDPWIRNVTALARLSVYPT